MPVLPGVSVWIDPADWTNDIVTTDANGGLSTNVSLGATPGLVGSRLVYQLVLVTNQPPFSVDLTNGVELLIGN